METLEQLIKSVTDTKRGFTNDEINEMKERFKNARVNVGVYIDSEGCSYNSVYWK